MGDPATPTPKDRADTRELAARIVQSVIDDKAMPLGIKPEEFFGRPILRRRDVESLVFQLAQEIVLLRGNLNDACDLVSRCLDTLTAYPEAYEDPGAVEVENKLAELRRVVDHG